MSSRRVYWLVICAIVSCSGGATMRSLIFALGIPLCSLASAGAFEPAHTLALAPCKVPGGTEIVRCGRLQVPENWSKPEGRKIALNLIVMPKVGPGPQQPP